MRILIVDDTDTHHLSAEQTLKGHNIVHATTHDQAVELLREKYGPGEAQEQFDAVLVDLFMPVGGRQQSLGERFLGDMMPVGFSLALLAARFCGARYIGVVTATNHHHHPMSESLDHLSASFWAKVASECPAAFEINGAKVGFFHAPMIEIKGTKGKDWRKILDRLMGQKHDYDLVQDSCD